MGRALQKLVGWRELHAMYGKVWGKDSLEKGKYLLITYTAARVNVYYKLSSFFFQCYFRRRTDINGSLQLLDFFQESFLERGLHISMNGRFIFIFRWREHPNGVASALMGGGRQILGLGGTPIMTLPTRANPGLCCNRIKNKHELQYAL